MTAPSYQGTVLDVVDGDTVHVALDLGVRVQRTDRDCGFHVYVAGRRLVLHADVRLYGCNAAEHGTPGGDAATANLRALLPAGAPVTVVSRGIDKYGGRVDGSIVLPDGTDLVGELVAQGWAAAWDGTGTKPVPAWPR